MRTRNHQSGFSLPELLIAMIVMGIIAMGIYNIFRVHNLMAAKQDETTRMQQELLSVVARMSDDLRMCGYSPNPDVKLGFVTANNTGFVCNSTSVQNASVPVTIGYSLNAATNEVFSLNATGGWESAAVQISNLNFSYFDRSGNPAAVGNIRIVELSANATSSTDRRGLDIPGRFMNTRVYCRNLGL